MTRGVKQAKQNMSEKKIWNCIKKGPGIRRWQKIYLLYKEKITLHDRDIKHDTTTKDRVSCFHLLAETEMV